MTHQEMEIKIKELEKKVKSLEQTQKWIPVSSGEMPKEYEIVIASTKFGVYPEARYTKENGWEWAYQSLSDYYWADLKDVTAWMALPKRYEPQESEDMK